MLLQKEGIELELRDADGYTVSYRHWGEMQLTGRW